MLLLFFFLLSVFAHVDDGTTQTETANWAARSTFDVRVNIEFLHQQLQALTLMPIKDANFESLEPEQRTDHDSIHRGEFRWTRGSYKMNRTSGTEPDDRFFFLCGC